MSPMKKAFRYAILFNKLFNFQPYHWVSGPWSTCSRTCGTGFHFRRIECKVRKEMRLKDSITTNNSTNVPGSEPTVLSRMCMALEKPIVWELNWEKCLWKFDRYNLIDWVKIVFTLIEKYKFEIFIIFALFFELK
jgi:hypothetical protein